jgi:hypothetical protein
MQILLMITLVMKLSTAQHTVLPNTCQDLLPNMDDFIVFFQDVGVLWSYSDQKQAKKVFELVAMRDIYQKKNMDWINPIDNMIKDYLCQCYTLNKEELYYSSSEVIRTYLKANLNIMMEKAQMRYVELEVKEQVRRLAGQYEKQNRMRLMELQKIAKLEMQSRIQRIVDREMKKVTYRQLFTENY